MIPRIHLIPGINITRYYDSIGVMGDYFRKMGFVVIDHPKFIPFGLSFALNRGFVREIANTVHAADVLIGHSNGAFIANEVSKLTKVKGVVFINGAIERTAKPGYVDFRHNYYSKGDDTLWWTKFTPDWGRAGKVGLKTHDPRDTNISLTAQSPAVRGHADIFDGKHAHFWAPRIGNKILEACGVTITKNIIY